MAAPASGSPARPSKPCCATEEENPGAGWTSTLGTCLAGALGGTDWNIVRSFVYGGDRGKIGSLARAVGEAAQADDATALRILREAGEELARLANALIKRLGPRPVALVGGSARLHPVLSDAFRKELVGPRRVHRHRSRRGAHGGAAGGDAQQGVMGSRKPSRKRFPPPCGEGRVGVAKSERCAG